MKAAIFNPYLDTLGGGERYVMTFAEVLSRNGYDVDVEWRNEDILRKSEKRFSINLSGVKTRKDIKKGEGYDLCFWVSDGSIPLLRARENILHFQFPFRNVDGKSLFNKLKLFRIKKVICNSQFTKHFIDKEYGVDSIVLYPPVGVDKIKPLKKENLIIYVGRFSKLAQVKRQDVLIQAFKKYLETTKESWRLVLAGGTEVGVSDLNELKSAAKNLPVEILENPEFSTLKVLYGKAKFFWSAAGFGVDEEKDPTKVEHFGITPVEAMAGGAVPLLFDSGGHKEIIKDSVNGYLWSSVDELLEKTKDAYADKKLFRSVSQKALDSSADFGIQRFENEVLKILT